MNKKKIDLKKKKDNTIQSLKEVENFLRSLKKVSKGKKIYNLLKKK